MTAVEMEATRGVLTTTDRLPTDCPPSLAPVAPLLAPRPSPPFVEVPGLANLRDVGGYAAGARGVIRRGLLFRSAQLEKVQQGGGSGGGCGDACLAALHRLHLTHVFDLRSLRESSPAGSPESAGSEDDASWLLAGAKRIFAPVFLEEDYSPETIAVRFKDYSDGVEGFVRAYSSVLASAASPENPYQPFRTILNHLADPSGPPSPILVHCTAGKDRTGVFYALLLALCGVHDEVIAHEYSLTDLGLAERKEEIVQRLIRGEALYGDRRGAVTMVSARKEYMLATLDMIRQRYGSVEGYVIDHCRVSPETIKRLRRNLVVNVTDAEQPLDWRSHAKVVNQWLAEGER